MHCFFGKGEQCNYIHCNSAGGEGCISHKGWQNKREREREREKRRRHFQLKQLKFLWRVLYILNPHPTIYTVSNKLHSSHTHTRTKRAWSSICFQLDIHTASCKSLIALSTSLSRMHACLYTHACTHIPTCMHTNKHAYTHTHTHACTHTHLLHSLPCHYAQASSSSSSSKSSSSSSSTCKQNNDYAVKRTKSTRQHQPSTIHGKELLFMVPISQSKGVYKGLHTHTRAYMTECTYASPLPQHSSHLLCVCEAAGSNVLNYENTLDRLPIWHSFNCFGH